MKQEQIDKCIDFAEGKKGKFTILMAKNPNFPENLLTGTEKQQEINEYVNQNYTTRQIAEMMQCTQPNIVEHMKQYRKGREFYYEWCEFWETIKNVREIPINIAFERILSSEEITKYQNKGIETVGDYLHCAVTMSSRNLWHKMLGEENNQKKSALFDCIKQLCHKSYEDEYV